MDGEGEEVVVVEPDFPRNETGSIIYACQNSMCVVEGLEKGHYHEDVPYLIWKHPTLREKRGQR